MGPLKSSLSGCQCVDQELWPGRHAHRGSDINASGEAPGDNDGPATASASQMAVNRIEWPTP